ncbi:MAG: hypothetical protein R2728_06900 [Chitinophagales bacterium]
MPGIHHVIGRTIKRIFFIRYKTLKGYQVKKKRQVGIHMVCLLS